MQTFAETNCQSFSLLVAFIDSRLQGRILVGFCFPSSALKSLIMVLYVKFPFSVYCNSRGKTSIWSSLAVLVCGYTWTAFRLFPVFSSIITAEVVIDDIRQDKALSGSSHRITKPILPIVFPPSSHLRRIYFRLCNRLSALSLCSFHKFREYRIKSFVVHP